VTIRIALRLPALAFLALAAAAPALAAPATCPPDSIRVGTTCVDRFEASVWLVQQPARRQPLLKRIANGKVTAQELLDAGAVQLGCDEAPPAIHSAFPLSFPENGNWTPVLGTKPPSPGIYAVSVEGVVPTSCVTWFQAEQACAASGKRLLTNEEWQRAAAGTPDPALIVGPLDCATVTPTAGPVPTGSRTACVSSWGVSDMVGNLSEWVGDWADLNNPFVCDTNAFGDRSCFGGSGLSPLPGALHRGGGWADGSNAGVFAVNANLTPDQNPNDVGFRCAR
jgi:hypothetical protein